jgi:hypothetical protein
LLQEVLALFGGAQMMVTLSSANLVKSLGRVFVLFDRASANFLKALALALVRKDLIQHKEKAVEPVTLKQRLQIDIGRLILLAEAQEIVTLE